MMSTRFLLLLLAFAALLVCGAGAFGAKKLPLTIAKSPWLSALKRSFEIAPVNSAGLQDGAHMKAPRTPTKVPISADRRHRWLVDVTIGRPSQSFKLAIDINTALSFVQSLSCDASGRCAEYCSITDWCSFICKPACCGQPTAAAAANAIAYEDIDHEAFAPTSQTPIACAARRKFNESASTSYKLIAKDAFAAFHGTSEVYGDTASDTITFGVASAKLQLDSGIFGLVTEATGIFATDPNIDGVFGLSKAISLTSGGQSLLEQAYRASLVPKWSYTIWTDESNSAGSLTLGDANDAQCHGTFGTIANNKEFAFTIIQYQIGQGAYSSSYNGQLDVEQAFHTLPASIVNKIAAKTGATYDQKRDLWIAPCNAQFSVLFTTPLNSFHIEARNVLIEVAPETCVLLIKTAKAGAATDTNFILGAPILDYYCIQFDVGHDLMLFAKKNQN